MWKLVIEDDEGKRTVVPLTREDYSVGRKEGNTIRLTERNVSRDHAKLHKKNGVAHSQVIPPSGPDVAPNPVAYVLEDMSSYNGVYVNGLRVAVGARADARRSDSDRRLPDGAARRSGRRTAPPDRTHQRRRKSDHSDGRDAGLPPHGALSPIVSSCSCGPDARGGISRSIATHYDHRLARKTRRSRSITTRFHVCTAKCALLGDSRYEIRADKRLFERRPRERVGAQVRASSKPADIIELGDVKFKFVGAAGQIRFLPGVERDSQQLATIGDRGIDGARDVAGMVIPILSSSPR